MAAITKDQLNQGLTDAFAPAFAAGDKSAVYDTEKNPFGSFLIKQKEEYVSEKLKAARAQHNDLKPEQIAAQENAFRKTFDNEKLPELAKQLQAKALGTYDGKNDVAVDPNIMQGIASGGINGALNGDFFGGIIGSIKDAVTSLILSLPWVGDKIGQFTTMMSNWMSGKSAGKSWGDSWNEAGEQYQQDKIADRMNKGLGQLVSADGFSKWMNEEAAKPVAETADKAPAVATASQAPAEAAAKTVTDAPTANAAAPAKKEEAPKASEVSQDAKPAPIQGTPVSLIYDPSFNTHNGAILEGKPHATPQSARLEMKSNSITVA